MAHMLIGWMDERYAQGLGKGDQKFPLNSSVKSTKHFEPPICRAFLCWMNGGGETGTHHYCWLIIFLSLSFSIFQLISLVRVLSRRPTPALRRHSGQSSLSTEISGHNRSRFLVFPSPTRYMF